MTAESTLTTTTTATTTPPPPQTTTTTETGGLFHLHTQTPLPDQHIYLLLALSSEGGYRPLCVTFESDAPDRKL